MKNFVFAIVASVGLSAVAIPASAQSIYEPYTFATLPALESPIGSSFPTGIAVDGSGNIYVAANETIQRITPAGTVTKIAGEFFASGSADGSGNVARFSGPKGLAVDSSGNLYVADTGNSTIRKMTPSGQVTTLAGLAGSTGSADGTGSGARFSAPEGVAVDGAGNVYVSDSENFTVRKITSSGVVSTVAGLAGDNGFADGTGSDARFSFPRGIAVDSAGNLYVVDAPVLNIIRKITPSRVVSTLAGSPGDDGSIDGTGVDARFLGPVGVAVDSVGNLYVADTKNHTVRKVKPSGATTTLGGLAGTSGNADGTGSAARFSNPEWIAMDAAGKIYISETGNGIIRVGSSGAPVILSPLTTSAVVGQQFVYEFRTLGATSRSVSNLPPGLTFNAALSSIVGKPTAAGTFQIGLTAANGTATTNATLTITVKAAPSSGPSIVSSTAATGRTGSSFRFQVITTGGSSATRLNATGLPAGLKFDPAAGIITGRPIADGSTAVTLSVADGNFNVSATLQLTFTSDPAVPVITSRDEAAVVPGQPFSYKIETPTSTANDPVSYTVVGDLPPGLVLDAATGIISGTPVVQSRHEGRGKPLSGGIITNVQLFAANSKGVATKPLPFFLPPVGVVNISTRLAVQTGENVLIGGFIITGNGPKKVIIRAIGPSLRVGGAPLAGALQNPTLQLLEGGKVLTSNTGWRTAQEEEIIDSTVPPPDDRESAIIAALNPGAYTTIVSGKDGGTGIGLVEVYDLGTASLDTASQAQLANISTRGFVQQNNDVMIGGFIVSGGAAKVLVRAIGPSLAQNGVAGALADTALELRDGNGSLIVANDDWRTGGQEQQIIDTTVPPDNDRESAVVATLNPGPYTAVVRGNNNGTGVGLVEAYVLK